MRNKLLVFGAALLVAATFGVIQLTADAATSCDKVNIVYCGLAGSSTQAQINSLRSYYDKGADTTNPHGHYSDLKAVYGWAGANQSMINGMSTSNTKAGTLYRSNGSIVVDGRTVGTNASMAARYTSGSGYTRLTAHAWARSVSPSHNVDSTYQVLVHFDKNGKADFAVAIDCANAVRFTPTPPPAPKPKPSAACSGLTVTKLSDHNYRFTAQATVKNGAKVTSYTFRVFDSSNKQIRIHNTKSSSTSQSFDYTQSTPGTYKATVTVWTSVGDTTNSSCAKTFSVPKPPVVPKPTAACSGLTIAKIDDNNFKFTAT
ncbi:MAG TPA: hypothetical protein VFQ70_03210, partial [Candidatus Saccharimonadaceae bacterium]|nr:hypothetical protein [Candidatus Saccharimonadaceae bacterium]